MVRFFKDWKQDWKENIFLLTGENPTNIVELGPLPLDAYQEPISIGNDGYYRRPSEGYYQEPLP